MNEQNEAGEIEQKQELFQMVVQFFTGNRFTLGPKNREGCEKSKQELEAFFDECERKEKMDEPRPEILIVPYDQKRKEKWERYLKESNRRMN